MKNPITSIVIIVLLFLSAVVGAFFTGKTSGKRDTSVVVKDSIVYVTEYIDTCFPVQIDSMEIYRTVRKGILTKVTPKKEEIKVSKDTTKSILIHADSLLTVTTNLLHTGEIHEVEYEIELDTPYIIQNVYITDTVPVYQPVQIVEKVVEKVTEVPVERSAFGAKIGTGTTWTDPFGDFAVNVGLFYQDKKRRIYSVDVGTNQMIQASFFVPIFK